MNIDRKHKHFKKKIYEINKYIEMFNVIRSRGNASSKPQQNII